MQNRHLGSRRQRSIIFAQQTDPQVPEVTLSEGNGSDLGFIEDSLTVWQAGVTSRHWNIVEVSFKLLCPPRIANCIAGASERKVPWCAVVV
jgi:hypothetical protein